MYLLEVSDLLLYLSSPTLSLFKDTGSSSNVLAKLAQSAADTAARNHQEIFYKRNQYHQDFSNHDIQKNNDTTIAVATTLNCSLLKSQQLILSLLYLNVVLPIVVEQLILGKCGFNVDLILF